MVRMCIYWIAVSTIGAAWALAAGRRTRPGWQRAMLLAPLVAVQLAATPFLVDAQRTPALVVLVMGMMSLSAFKARHRGTFIVFCDASGQFDSRKAWASYTVF